MFSKPKIFSVLLILFAAPAAARAAEDVYETPANFIASAFSGGSSAGTITISGETAEAVKAIFNGRSYRASRVRYYRSGDRTAWVLDEIGKTKPITIGVVVDGGKIDTIKVLIYRESIGDEVRRPAFTKQFNRTTLKDDRRRSLSRRINSISGATLSSQSMDRVARLALLLHAEVVKS